MDGLRPLGGRYTFVKNLRSAAKTITWLAHEKVTTTDVVASVVPKPRAAGLAPILGARHEHLATILDLIEHPDPEEIPSSEPIPDGAVVAVAEYVRGHTLGARLDVGPLAVEDAVEWAARLADGLALIHRRGGVHGAISPRAILVSRSDRGTVPLLTQLVVPPSGAYCGPERVTGAGPSIVDDLWALVATLYSALSRRAPFHGATRTDLARAIVAAEPAPLEGVDGDLAEIVRRGLSRDPQARFDTAVSLRGALRDWMERTGARSLGDFAPVSTAVGPAELVPNVGDLSLVAALAQPDTAEARAPVPSLVPLADDDGDLVDISAEPAEVRPGAPPEQKRDVPEAAAPVGVVVPRPGIKTTPPAKKRSSSTLLLLLVAVGLASAGVGGLIGRLRARGRSVSESREPVAQVENPVGVPSTAQSEATAVGGPASAEAVPAAPSAAPAGAAAPSRSGRLLNAAGPASAAPEDVTACVARTLPDGTLGEGSDVGFLCAERDFWTTVRKFDLEVAKHGKGPGMVLFAHLGRYDLAAVAFAWQTCCPADSTPFVVATPKGVCDTLTDAVRAAGKDPSPAVLDAYAAAIDCLYTRGVHHPTEFWDRVGPKDARGYFDQFRDAVTKAR